MKIVELEMAFTKFITIIGISARRRAISLIEGVLYLVIALAVIVGGIVFFQQSQLSNAVTNTARAAVGISSQARALYQNHTGFGDNVDLTRAMIRSGAVPSSFIDNTGDAIAHPFGGAVTVTGNGKGFVITYSDISEAACLRLANINETGVGPMGTGIVGLTVSSAPIDPTTPPEITGAAKSDAVASFCNSGSVMSVYYAQNPGAKFAESGGGSSNPFDTSNHWDYPFPRAAMSDVCGDEPRVIVERPAWRQCVYEWGVGTHGELNMGTSGIEMCGVRPNQTHWDKEPDDWRVWFNKAEDTYDECYTVWSYRWMADYQ